MEFHKYKHLWNSINHLWNSINHLWNSINHLWNSINTIDLWNSINQLWNSINDLWNSINHLWNFINDLWNSINHLWNSINAYFRALRLAIVLRPLRKPFCSSLIMLDSNGLSLLVMQREISLYVVFSRDMGLQFLSRSLELPVFGRHVISPCFCDWVSVLFS